MNYIFQLDAFMEHDSLERRKLKPTAICAYIALFHINNRCGWKTYFRATKSDITNYAGFSDDKTYYQALEELVKGGFIEWQKGPNQHQAPLFSLKVLYDKKEMHGGSTGVANTNAPELLSNSTGGIPKQINNKPVNISFDDFWNLYDHKKDKPACEKLWQKLNDSDREVIIKNVPAYIQATPDKTFRKHPKTYLNNKSWENDIPTPAATNTGSSTNKQSIDSIKAFKDKKEREKALLHNKFSIV